MDAWQEALEGCQQVVVRPRAELHDHEPGGGVGDEDGQQAIAGADVDQEAATGIGEVGQRRIGAGLDGQLASLHGLRARRGRARGR